MLLDSLVWFIFPRDMSFSVVLFPAPAATILTTAPPPGLDPRLTSLDCKKRVYNSLLYSGARGAGYGVTNE